MKIILLIVIGVVIAFFLIICGLIMLIDWIEYLLRRK